MDHQFTMAMLGSEPGNLPKIYSLSMSEDIVPMCDFSETPQGRGAVEGKAEHKFDMKPNSDSIEDYRRLCRERTNKSMIKNHEIQVIDNDLGVHMRPIPGMIGLISSTSKQLQLEEILNELCVYNKRGAHQGAYELKPEYKKSAEDAAE